MLDKNHYKDWTDVFTSDPRYEGKWEKGSKMIFLGTDENGETTGMVSRIKEYDPYNYVSIEYYGMIKNGEEITSGPEIEGWKGATETYTFREEDDGTTTVYIDVDSNQDYKEYMSETWPIALNKLKTICEEVKKV